MKKATRKTKAVSKPKKIYAPEVRVNRAYQTAAEVMLFMHIDKKPITVQVLEQPFCYTATYSPSDFRMLVVATIGVLAAPLMRADREVDSNKVYSELLALDDPNCFMDKITEEEAREMVTLVLSLLLRNWYVIESVATTLLSYTHDQQTVVGFAPTEYSFAE